MIKKNYRVEKILISDYDIYICKFFKKIYIYIFLIDELNAVQRKIGRPVVSNNR